jgi:hypothetical protein
MKNKYIIWVVSFALYFACNQVYAQKVQVVTKTIEKDLPYATGEQIKVNAEKSAIEVHGWAKNSIHIKVKLISKHADKKTAERELEYLHFGVTEGTKLLELTNTFVLPKNIRKVEGNLKTEYEIWMPSKAITAISDKFGTIKLSTLSGASTLSAEYCNIVLTGCQGDISITAVFSDTKGTALNCNLKCKNDHADINLDVTGGTYQIETTYGKVSLNAPKKINALTINASRCPISITTNGFEQYQYDLQTTEAIIDLPSTKYNIYRKDLAHQKCFVMKASKKGASIKIKTTFEQISVQ